MDWVVIMVQLLRDANYATNCDRTFGKAVEDAESGPTQPTNNSNHTLFFTFLTEVVTITIQITVTYVWQSKGENIRLV